MATEVSVFASDASVFSVMKALNYLILSSVDLSE